MQGLGIAIENGDPLANLQQVFVFDYLKTGLAALIAAGAGAGVAHAADKSKAVGAGVGAVVALVGVGIWNYRATAGGTFMPAPPGTTMYRPAEPATNGTAGCAGCGC
jgi:hypothetical protein